MYNPPANRVDDIDEIHDLLEQAAFGQVVSHVAGRFEATGLPLLLDRSAGELGTLRGHFARANEQWRGIDGADVLVIFQLTNGYVSPAWYPSKLTDPRVVPTWNYEVVHVHGVARIQDDADWVRRLVTDLTERQEAERVDLDAAPPWAVTDAPADFVDRQLRAIVGVEFEITQLDGKRKLSQNRSDDDRLGVTTALESSSAPSDQAVAAAMRRPST